MSQAERLANALGLARLHADHAATAATRYHTLGTDTTWPVLEANLGELRLALDTMQTLTNTDLPRIAKSLADHTRVRHIHSSTPDNTPWPDAVQSAAAEADQALSKLRAHLEKTPAEAAHNALSDLLNTVRTARRRTNR